jgi:hypothetical protein
MRSVTQLVRFMTGRCRCVAIRFTDSDAVCCGTFQSLRGSLRNAIVRSPPKTPVASTTPRLSPVQVRVQTHEHCGPAGATSNGSRVVSEDTLITLFSIFRRRMVNRSRSS